MTTFDKKKLLITTAIDYTNDVIHVGHAYEKILADIAARYGRKLYGNENLYFSTGTDEYGTTNEKAAASKGISPKQHVDSVSTLNKSEYDSLNISYNRFIRTTDEDHKKVAQDLFMRCLEKGDLYKGTYKGFYCEGCESAKTMSDLDENSQCPLHPTRQIQILEEENYFFRWNKFAEYLRELVSGDFVMPEFRKNEMLAFLDRGLDDITVSRPVEKVSWGIPVPNDPTQVIYVWFDALINYYTIGSQNGFWNEDTKIIHFVGKDILRFHVLLWPAMLKSLGIQNPDIVYTHAFLNLDGNKISKSRGNVIKPSDLVVKYGLDATRYYLTKFGPITDDTNISTSHLEEIYNADLANSLGNTVSRLSKLISTAGFDLPVFYLDEAIWKSEIFEPMSEFRVDMVLQNVWNKIGELEKHINVHEPWTIKDPKKLEEVLVYELNEIRIIAVMLEIFIPETAKKIQSIFAGPKIEASSALFPRLG